MRRLSCVLLLVVCAAVSGVAQSDNCAITSVPRYWDFESGNTGGYYSFPLCWSRAGNYFQYFAPVIADHGCNGIEYGNVLYVVPINNYAILPPIDPDSLNINKLQLTFYGKISYPEDSYMTVGVMEDCNDTSTFTPVQHICLYGFYGSNRCEYQRYTIPFDNYSGAGTYIALRFRDRQYGYHQRQIYDNFTIDTIPSCPEPSNLIVDTVYESSVSLSWVGFDTSAISYTLYYKAASEQEWSYRQFTTTAPRFLLTGLNHSTYYEAYVVSDCAVDMPSNYVKFMTECKPIETLPQTWDFEFYNVLDNPTNNYNNYNILPDCWNRYITNLSFDSSGSSSDNHSLRLSVDATSVAKAVLPEINTDSLNINNLQLSFKIRTDASPDIPVILEVGVQKKPLQYDSPEDSMVVVQVISSISKEYQQFDIPLNTYNGNGSFMSLRAATLPQSGYYSVYIDDVVLDTVPECPRPNHLVLQQLSETSLTFGWTGHNANHPAYACYYRAKGDTLWSVDTFSAVSAMHTLGDLRHSTEYELFLVNGCDTAKRSETLVFSTLCDEIATLPYTWNFDANNTAGSLQYPLPACWSRNTGNYPYVASQSHSQDDGMKLIFSNDSPSTVVLPRINTDSLSPDSLQVSFSALITDNINNEINRATLTIGVMSHPDSAESFVPVHQITEFTTDFQEYSVPLSGYEGAGSYIAFRNSGSDGTFIWLDNLEIDTIPACQRPSALRASHPTTHSVTLHWSGYGDAQLLVNWRAVGDSVWNESVASVSGYSLEVDSLSSSTSYEFFVAAACNPALKSNTIAVTTLCEPITELPQTWDFDEDNTAGTAEYPLPACWIRTGDFFPHVMERDIPQQWTFSGGRCLSFINSVNSPVVLPVIDTSVLQISDLMLSFYANSVLDGEGDRIVVGVMDDPTDVFTFVPVDTVDGLTAEPKAFDVPLSAYNGSGSHIAMNTFGLVNNYNIIYLDDLKLQANPGCLRPKDLHLTNVDIYSAALAWESSSDSVQYVIAYRKTGNDTVLYDTTSVLYSNPHFTLSNLDANTSYEAMVSSSCYPGAWSEAITFTTLCAKIESLPVFWDFENDNTGGTDSRPLPTCWSRTTSGSNTNVPFIYNNASYSYSGSKALNFWKSQGWYVTMPALSDTIPANTLAMSFYLKCASANSIFAHIEIGVMSDPDDVSTFFAIDTLDLTDNYRLVDVDFSAYNGNGRFIAFHDISHPGAETDVFIDDLRLMYIPECPRPTALTATNVDSRTADIIWTHDADSTQYLVYYRISGTELWKTDTVVTTAITLENLMPSTIYEVMVTAQCNPDNPSVVMNFTTECAMDIIQVPQTWGFEEVAHNTMPSCWTKIVGSTAYMSNYPCVEATSHSQSGSKALCFYRSEGSMAVMPYIDSNNLDIRQLQVSFYIYNNYGNRFPAAKIDVGVMTDPSNPSTFMLVQTIDSLPQEFINVTVPFNNYEGDGLYIAFRDPNSWYDHIMNPNFNYDIYIDSLTISLNEDVPCAMPVQIEVTDITDSSAVISWQDVISPNATYQVNYKPSSESVWQVETVNTGKMCTLKNLEPETAYDCYVVALCNPEMPTDTIHFETEAKQPDSVGVAKYVLPSKLVQLYPNPSNDFVNVCVRNGEVSISNIEICDLYGRVVCSANADSPLHVRVNISHFVAGTYIARVVTNAGVANLKFVKQ